MGSTGWPGCAAVRPDRLAARLRGRDLARLAVLIARRAVPRLDLAARRLVEGEREGRAGRPRARAARLRAPTRARTRASSRVRRADCVQIAASPIATTPSASGSPSAHEAAAAIHELRHRAHRVTGSERSGSTHSRVAGKRARGGLEGRLVQDRAQRIVVERRRERDREDPRIAREDPELHVAEIGADDALSLRAPSRRAAAGRSASSRRSRTPPLPSRLRARADRRRASVGSRERRPLASTTRSAAIVSAPALGHDAHAGDARQTRRGSALGDETLDRRAAEPRHVGRFASTRGAAPTRR